MGNQRMSHCIWFYIEKRMNWYTDWLHLMTALPLCATNRQNAPGMCMQQLWSLHIVSLLYIPTFVPYADFFCAYTSLVHEAPDLNLFEHLLRIWVSTSITLNMIQLPQPEKQPQTFILIVLILWELCVLCFIIIFYYTHYYVGVTTHYWPLWS